MRIICWNSLVSISLFGPNLVAQYEPSAPRLVIDLGPVFFPHHCAFYRDDSRGCPPRPSRSTPSLPKMGVPPTPYMEHYYGHMQHDDVAD